MELSDVEMCRCTEDRNLDGFFDYVEVARISGNQRIVHRENHKWLGVVDESDNVLLPLIYDKLKPKGYGVETTVEASSGVFRGLYDGIGGKIIFPAIYDVINPAIDNFWCYDKTSWRLMSRECKTIMELPYNALPLDHDKYICILRKNSNRLNIEVLGDNYNHSQRRLRTIALESSITNRIVMTSKYFNLNVYSDIYGNVIYTNIDVDYILSLGGCKK